LAGERSPAHGGTRLRGKEDASRTIQLRPGKRKGIIDRRSFRAAKQLTDNKKKTLKTLRPKKNNNDWGGGLFRRHCRRKDVVKDKASEVKPSGKTHPQGKKSSWHAAGVHNTK